MPVLVGPKVGTAPLVTRTDAGGIWWPPERLGPAVRRLIAERATVVANGAALAAALDPAALADELFAHIDAALGR